MAAAKLNIKELLALLDNIESELLQLLLPLSDKKINAIPFENSWTIAQVVTHVTKSTTSIAQALNMESKTVARKPDEREQELKKMFLDFTIKMKSPDFILPANEMYRKEIIIADLLKSFERLKKESNNVNLSEAINHRAFGDITKLELLYFVLYHTQRHIRQVKNIFEMINNKNSPIEGLEIFNN